MQQFLLNVWLILNPTNDKKNEFLGNLHKKTLRHPVQFCEVYLKKIKMYKVEKLYSYPMK